MKNADGLVFVLCLAFGAGLGIHFESISLGVAALAYQVLRYFVGEKRPVISPA